MPSQRELRESAKSKTGKKQPEPLKLTTPAFEVDESESGTDDDYDDESESGSEYSAESKSSRSSKSSTSSEKQPPQSGLFGFIRDNIRYILIAILIVLIVCAAIWVLSIRVPQRAADIHSDRANINLPPEEKKQVTFAEPPENYEVDRENLIDDDLARLRKARAEREATMRDATEKQNSEKMTPAPVSESPTPVSKSESQQPEPQQPSQKQQQEYRQQQPPPQKQQQPQQHEYFVPAPMKHPYYPHADGPIKIAAYDIIIGHDLDEHDSSQIYELPEEPPKQSQSQYSPVPQRDNDDIMLDALNGD